MSGKLIPNPPSHDHVLAWQNNTPMPNFDITEKVREAVINSTADAAHYQVIVDHLQGGKITGNKVADAYKLAEHLVQWEAEVGNTSLKARLGAEKIQLNAIVKRLPAMLRKHAGMDVQAWVCVGTMITHQPEEADLQVVNG